MDDWCRRRCWRRFWASRRRGHAAEAQLYINEVFFNPGGQALDSREEFIELRGTPNTSLENYYLIFVEGDDDVASTGEAGSIDNVFDLNYNSVPATGQLLGSNGFLTLRQKNSRYAVQSGTNDRDQSRDGIGFRFGSRLVDWRHRYGGQRNSRIWHAGEFLLYGHAHPEYGRTGSCTSDSTSTSTTTASIRRRRRSTAGDRNGRLWTRSVLPRLSRPRTRNLPGSMAR